MSWDGAILVVKEITVSGRIISMAEVQGQPLLMHVNVCVCVCELSMFSTVILLASVQLYRTPTCTNRVL